MRFADILGQEHFRAEQSMYHVASRLNSFNEILAMLDLLTRSIYALMLWADHALCLYCHNFYYEKIYTNCVNICDLLIYIYKLLIL